MSCKRTQCAVPPVRYKPVTPQSQVEHSTTKSPCRVDKEHTLKYHVFENVLENKRANAPFSIIFSKVFKTLLKFFLIFFSVV